MTGYEYKPESTLSKVLHIVGFLAVGVILSYCVKALWIVTN